jgi:RNA polymerase sigma-70 factor (family 1)
LVQQKTKLKTAKPDLVALWRRICLENDSQAFEQLYRFLFTRLLKFGVYYVGDKQAAEDLVTEVFVRSWENRAEGTHVLNPESYFFISVKNQSLKHLAKKNSRDFVDVTDVKDDIISKNQSPQEIMERKELHRQLDLAIDGLAPQAATVFRMIKESGMKYKEVADLLNISPRTVQTQLFRAIAKLRVVLKPLIEQRNDGAGVEKLISLAILAASLSFLIFL